MDRDKIACRQLLALLFAGLFSPMIQLLPGHTVEFAGRGAFLAPLAALPGILALGWALEGSIASLPRGGGMAQVLEQAFGRWVGRLLTGVYLVWAAVLLGLNLRWAAFRFLATSYRNAPLTFFIVVLLLMTLWLGLGKFSAFARAGEIFFFALGAVLVVTLVFSLSQVRAEGLLPVWTEDVPGILRSGGAVLSLTGYSVFAAFCAGGVTRRPNEGKRTWKWALGYCAVLTLFQVVCIGSFGEDLVQRMDIPYFMAVKGIGVEGAFQRVESLVIALWVLADLALLGLLVFACRSMLGYLRGTKWSGRRGGILAAGVAGMVALVWAPDASQLAAWMRNAVAWSLTVLGWMVPLAAAVVLMVRKKYDKRYKRKEDGVS